MEKIITKFLINEEDFLDEKDSISYKLLQFLFEKNYFINLEGTNYYLGTITIINKVFNRIMNIEQFSYRKLKILIKDEIKIQLLRSIETDFDVLSIINSYITEIEEIINECNNKVLPFLEGIKFSGFDFLKTDIKKFVYIIETEDINKFKEVNEYKIKFDKLIGLVNNFCKTVFQDIFSFKDFILKDTIIINPNQKEIDSKLINLLNILFIEKCNLDYKYDDYILIIFYSFLNKGFDKRYDFLQCLYDCFLIYKNILNFDLFILKRKEDFEDESKNEKLDLKKIKYNIGVVCAKNIIYEKIYIPYNRIILTIFEAAQNEVIKKEEFTFKKLNSFLKSIRIEYNFIIYSFEEIEILFEKINKRKFIQIIKKLYENIESLKFLLSITTKDCINIQEFAGEVFDGNNQNYLSLEDLRFIEKLVELFERIRNFDYKFYKNDDIFIIEHLSEKLEPEENNLIKYFNNFREFEQFFNEKLNSSKFITETIQKILNKSEFILMNSDIGFFNGFIIVDENKPESINYDFLIGLRDRAINNTYKKVDYNKKFKEAIDKDEEIMIKNNKVFIEYIHQINELLKLIKRITKKGLLFKFEKIEELNNNKENDILSFLNEIENNFFLLKIKINISKKDDCYESQFFLKKKKKK